jgi:hypothetical protein
MYHIPRWRLRTSLAALTLLALLLAACGAETTTSGLRGAATPHASATAGTTANATPGAQPYTFPTAWQAAAGAPTQVSLINGMTFAPSQPLTGYACDNEPPAGTPTGGSDYAAAIYITHDGGQTWTGLNGARFTQQPGNCTVFVNPTDANDVLVNGGVASVNQPQPSIWRSQDGGTTWHQLTAPTVPGWPSIGVQKMTVLGARLVVSVYINGEGQLANDLYASDDGGTTWHQFAASLPANVEDFVTLGGAIIVQTIPPVAGSAQRSAPSTTAHAGASRTLAATAPRSSGGPAPVFYRSDDGGNTWAMVTIPGGLPIFTQAATGNNFYGVSIVPPKFQFTFATAYWTQDSGAHWRALPTLEGVASNWIDPNSLGIGLTVGPDGTVFTDTQHGGINGDSDSGTFMLHPADSTPAWQPLAPDAPYSMAAVPVNGSVRLVNVLSTSTAASTGTPVYLDLP